MSQGEKRSGKRPDIGGHSTRRKLDLQSSARSSLRLAAVAIAAVSAQTALAATYTWDANTGTAGTQDGAGTWTQTQSAPTNWIDAANGQVNTLAPTAADTAIFGANSAITGATVTLGSAVQVAQITFAQINPTTTPYNIAGSGGNTLTVPLVKVQSNAGAGNQGPTIAAQLVGSAGFTLTADSNGVLHLAGANTYTGGTTVLGGSLRIANASALPGTTNVVLNGSTNVASLESIIGGTRTFSGLGTSAGQIQVLGNSGFGSRVSNSIFQIGTAGSTLTWGSTDFNPTTLRFNSTSGAAQTTLNNSLDLNGGARVITMTSGNGVIGGSLIGSTGSSLTVNGNLTINNASSFGGNIILSSGIFLAPNTTFAGNFRLAGGIFQHTGNVTGALGTGNGEVQLTGGTTGFAANSSSTLTINLGGTGATVQWGTTAFNPSNLALGLAGPTGDHTVWMNGIDLNSAGTRTIINQKNNQTNGDVVLGGVISNTLSNTGTLTLNNASGGLTILTAANTMAGTLNITGGGTVQIGQGGATGSINNVTTVALANTPTGGAGANTSSLIFNRSGTLNITSNITGGLNDATRNAVTVMGPGTVVFSGNNTYVNRTAVTGGTLLLDYSTNNTSKVSSAATMTLGTATLQVKGNAGAATSQTVNGLILSAATSSKLIVDGNGGPGTTLNIGSLTVGSGATIDFNTIGAGAIATTAVNGVYGILGRYATFADGTAFAAVSGGNIVAYTPANKNDVSTWATNDNISNTAGFFNTLTASTTIGTLRFNAASSPSTVSLGSNQLIVGDGAILMTAAVGANEQVISGGTLTSLAADLQVIQNDLAAGLTINSQITGAITLAKGGVGAMTIGGANNYTGATVIGGGSLIVTGDLGTGATTVGSGALLQIGNGGTSGSLSNTASINNLGTVAISRSDDITLAKAITGTGAFTKSGAGRVGVTVGQTYSGVTTVNQGILALDSGGTIYGGTAASVGSVVINNGGTFLFNRNDVFGNAGSNPVGVTFTVNAGGKLASGGFINNIGPVTLNGGTIEINGGFFHGSFSLRGGITTGGSAMSTITAIGAPTGDNYINLSNGGTTFNVADAVAGTDLLVTAWLNNGFAAGGQADNLTSYLNKTGTGTMSLAQNNTYGGPTTVTAGTLLANNNGAGSATGTGAVSVLGTLGGSGRISGTVNVASGGTLAPGDSVGTLSTGSLTLSGGSSTILELATVGESDKIVVTGDLALGGTLTIIGLEGFDAGSYEIMTYTGGLSGVLGLASLSVNGFDVALDTGTANSVFLNVSEVPEPGSVSLIALAAGSLLSRRRKSRANRSI